MIEIENKQFIIDGKPQIVMCGEVHYFRLKRDEWQDRIDKLRAAGCNGVASYVPWLCHEPIEGQVDLEGRTRPELDLGAFIDLCKERGLYFFARPGPFIMAEMKNEGLPYWVYTRHPEIVPLTWDGKPALTRTVDYLAPGFLEEVRHWYQAVMPVIAPRLQPNGGNIISVQLDNEVGMLSWITNSPDLTAGLIEDFARWLHRRYDESVLKARYPFALDDPRVRDAEIRSPEEQFAAALLRDLGYYMRDRFARYLATLRSYAEDLGVVGVPFVVNVHGTEAGRGLTFPVGISQLYQSYTQAPGYLAGSDHYLTDLTVSNFQDLYLLDAFMESVNDPGQPLTSVEFQSESAAHGGGYGRRDDPSAIDFKTRMCIAQGNRLINYYLFSGGNNYHLEQPPGDGNDRISFTGERHGVAAPVNPEGDLTYTYPALQRVVRTVMAVSGKLAVMEEEHDPVAFAFIPDYYMTEYRYPASKAMAEIIANLEMIRGQSAWESVARAMLFGGYRFGALDIQHRPVDPQTTPVLVLPSARYMDGALQQKIVDYLRAGGNLLLYGEVPLAGMEGEPCTLLADALSLRPAGSRTASAFYYLSLYSDGWAAPHPEVRTDHAQVYEPARGEVILRVVGTGEACGFDIGVGKGRAIVITAAYDCDVPFFRSVLERLGAKAALGHDCPSYGIFMTTSASKDGERFLHLLNLDGFDKTIHVTEKGQDLFGGRSIVLRKKEALTVPLNVSFGGVRIAYSTAEIAKVESQAIEFRLSQPQDVIALNTGREIVPSEDYLVGSQGSLKIVTSRKRALLDDHLTLRWK